MEGGNTIINPVAFNIGSISIYWYGIIIGLSVVIGLLITLGESKRQGINTDFFLDYVILGVPVAVIIARTYYVIFRWDIYKKNYYKIIALWEGGLAIHGAIIGGFIILFWLSKKKKVNFWQALDILAPAVVIGQAIGRWGNFINQEAHGGIVSQKFISHFPDFIQKQMYIYGNYYNPTFLYESLWDLMIFFFLLWFRRRNFIKRGDVFLSYLIIYSSGRFFIEGMRTDSLMLGPLRVAQLISIILIISASVLIYWRHYS